MNANAARNALIDAFVAYQPGLAASNLDSRDADEIAEFVIESDVSRSARLVERFVPEKTASVLSKLDPASANALLSEISETAAVAALGWLSEEQREELLGALAAVKQRELRQLLSFPPDAVGSLMDPQVALVRPTDTVEVALSRVAESRVPVYQLFVVDDERRLLGAVLIQDLAVAARDTLVSSLRMSAREAVDAFTHRDEVAEILTRTATPTIAVLDADGRLIGALRHRVLLGIAEEDVASRMQQMVGVSRDEQALSPVGFAIRKRLPWLNINLLTAFLAAAVVGLFEGTIAKVTTLAILLPVVAGQSGNSGSQALIVTMRGLALREIRAAHWPRVAAKEFAVGLANGAAIAVVTGLGVFLWSRNLMLSGVIAVSMVVSMASAGLAGASIPIVLQKLGQDPAQSSSIILTTVTDVVGFSTFLGLATILADKLV